MLWRRWLLTAVFVVVSQAQDPLGPVPPREGLSRWLRPLFGRSTGQQHSSWGVRQSNGNQRADSGAFESLQHYAQPRIHATAENTMAEEAEKGSDMPRGLMKKIELSGPLGRCLDGTMPVYYFAPGNQRHKWVVFFQGGDWCTRFHLTGQRDSARNCAQRARVSGTSRGKKPYKSIDIIGKMYNQLSEDPSENPMMYDWNKLYVQNCDATSFTSSLMEPREMDGQALYFRGKYIMDELLADSLENRGLGHATDLVISGCSAGGLTVFLHADLWRERLMIYARDRLRRPDADQIKVVGLADSGFFLARASACLGEYNFMARMRFLHDELNASAVLLPSCAESYPVAQRFRCLYAQNVLQHTTVPMFILQSAMDGWQLEWVACNATRDSPGGRLHAQLLADAAARAVHNGKVSHGAFVDGCQHHCHCFHRIEINGWSQARAFQQFYYNSTPHTRFWYDLDCHTELDDDSIGECPWKPLSWQKLSPARLA